MPPAAVRDEDLGNPVLDTTQAHTDSKTAVVHGADQMYRPSSSASSSDTWGNTSVASGSKHTGTPVIHAMESDTKSKNSAISQDEEMGFPTIKEVDFDTESKITISFDDDGSSTTTSEDSDADDTSQWGEPPPYESLGLDKPKKPPPFEADPVRYILGMKLPIAESGFCACNHKTSTYATVFFIICYAVMLIIDACTYITPIVRMLYAYKFQLFLTKEQQYVVHAWTGVLLLISAIVLWVGTYMKSRATLMVWLLVMLVYVVMSMVVWLLGLLLSFAANGWNTHSTTAISAGLIDIGLEFYLLHMVYSHNRYMFEKAPKIDFFDPDTAALRQMELERMGFREINILGIPIPAPMAPPPEQSSSRKDPEESSSQKEQGQQVTSV